MTLTTKAVAQISASHSNALDLGNVSYPLVVRAAIELADGTGANQADRMFSDTRALAASGTENLDLAGSLVDAFGNAITFARVKALYVAAAAGNANNVVVGGDATSTWLTWVGDETDSVIVRPGGVFLIAAPDAAAYAVTAATGDLLKISNSGAGTSVTYDIVIIGASA